MKLRRLQEIDLANAATAATENRKKSILKSVIDGFGPWSYDPARAATFSVFNPRTALGLDVEKPSLEKVTAQVRSQCTKHQQADSCVEVVELLHEWVEMRVNQAVEKRIPSVSLGPMGVVNYSINLVAQCDQRPTFLFLDHRRPGGCNNLGKRFALSMMNRQIRKVFTQFSDADLRILQFIQIGEHSRKIVETSVDEIELFSIEELDEMIADTFRVWQQLHEEKYGMRLKEA